MEFSIHFQGYRVPDQLWSEVQQNSVKIIDNSVEIEKAQNFSKLIIRDPKPNRIYVSLDLVILLIFLRIDSIF